MQAGAAAVPAAVAAAAAAEDAKREAAREAALKESLRSYEVTTITSDLKSVTLAISHSCTWPPSLLLSAGSAVMTCCQHMAVPML
jgi:cysteine sulfinate desulfinase/cysteine desulfurase-like protein